MSNILKISIGLFLSLVMLLMSVSYWIKTENGRSYLENSLSDITQEKWGVQLKLQDVDISLISGIRVSNISVYQNNNKVCSIDDIKTYLIPSIFMLWQVSLPSLTIKKVELLKLPILPSNTKEENILLSTKNINYAIPKISFKSIDINRFYIAKEVLDAEDSKEFSLKGKVVANFHSMIVHFKLDSLFHSESGLLEGANLWLSGKYNIKSQKLEISSHRFNSVTFNTEGNASIDRDSKEILAKFNYNYHLPESKGTVQIDGTLEKLNIRGDGEVSNLLSNLTGLEDLPLSTVKYSANFILDKKALEGQIELEENDLTATGHLVYKDNIIILKDFIANGSALTSTVDLEYNLSTGLANGNISYYDDSLEKLNKYFPDIIEGVAHFDAAFFSKNTTDQGLKIVGSVQDLSTSYGDTKNIELSFLSSSVFKKKVDKFDMLIKYFYTDNFIIKNIELDAASNNKGIIEYSANMLSRSPCLINFQSEGWIDPHEGIKFAMPYLDGNIGQSKIKLTEPLKLTLGNKFDIDMKKLQVGEGFIKLISNVQEQKVNSELEFNNISTKICDKIITNNFKDTIVNGKLTLNGSLEKPVLSAKLNTKHMLKKTSNIATVDIQAFADNLSSNIAINFKHDSDHVGSISAKASNNFSLSPLSFYFNKEKPINATIDLSKELDIFSLLPKLKEQKISGHFDGKLKISGTISQPILKGKMTLTEGKYRYKKHGVKIQHIKADIIPEAGVLLLDKIAAQDYLGNSLRGNGSVDLSENRYRFTFTTEEFYPLNNLYLNGALAGTAIYSGDKNNSLIEGNLVLGPVEIKIPERFNQNIPELNVVTTLDKNQYLRKSKQKREYCTCLDLKLKTNDQVFVRGLGVDTKLEGELSLTGDLDNPLVDGSLKSIEGKFKEFGRTLDVEKSTLVFNGPIPPSPYLNIIGITNVEDVEVRVMLSGSIMNPVLNVSSNPYMKKERALSLLLFGTTTENISPLQAIQLTATASRLSGKSGLLDPIDLSKKALNIDELNLKANTDDSGSYSLQAGKYLKKNIYFEIEHGIQDSSTKTRLEIQITPKISIETINGYKENNIGINWKFDY
ncbi:MAG TPA: translocation/assembly module TamB domain-containing protein [Candidatus Megaira endosymbiont of Nemacystus decipiens]|nr:translocation/assembly module TamB domain-containing protein [Candidatus Megaera endosymbiont of Nemacystus decipiens]